MAFGRFTVLTTIGSIPWVVGLAFAGKGLGSEWKTVRKGFEYFDYALLAAIVIGAVYLVVRRRASRKAAADVG
jgi:membrane protein DedA with SNARE-associated domain